jgi:hypothetical protein
MVAKTEAVTISAPNFQTAEFTIRGTAPYVQNKFSQKARQMMMDKQMAGATAKKGTKRDAKDFDAQYKGAMHIAEGGWHGIPASSFRAAMIDACRLVGFKMTHAKLGVFIEADGVDKDDGSPLVKFSKGEPERIDSMVKLATGVCDVTARPMWRQWEAKLRVKFDGDMFTLSDVSNLLARVGAQVGIGAGRPYSSDSAGCGWGNF